MTFEVHVTSTFKLVKGCCQISPVIERDRLTIKAVDIQKPAKHATVGSSVKLKNILFYLVQRI